MPAFCSSYTRPPSIGPVTLSNYNTKYVGESCLRGVNSTPDNVNSGKLFKKEDVNSNGVVDSTVLRTHVRNLLKHELIDAEAPTLGSMNDGTTRANLFKDNNPAKKFAEKAEALRSNIYKEYCYYYGCYKFALNLLLTDASVPAKVKLSSFDTLRNETIELNTTLNQILQVLQELNRSRDDSMTSYYSSAGSNNINSKNTNLEIQVNSLRNQATLLQNTNLKQDTQSAMIDYSIEKNSSSRNLLAIYGFMNIVAVGLLFYLYRSSK